MWVIIIIIVGIVIYFLFFNEEKSKNSSQRHSSTKESQKLTYKKPTSDWIFKREIDKEGVPSIINNYRKVIDGYDYKKIVRGLKGIAKIENEIERNLGYLQYIEPLAEIDRMGCFEFNPDMPHMELQYFLYDLINFFNDYYPVIGAKGQMKNLEDIFRFVPDLETWTENIAYFELEIRESIMRAVKEQGCIYKRDLNKIEGFADYGLNNNLIYRLLKYGILEEGRDGKYVIYTLKEPK